METRLLQEYERRDKRINFRVSEDEYSSIHKLCKTHDISVTTFIRNAMNDYAARKFSNAS